MSEILFSSWGGVTVDNRGKELNAFEKPEEIQLPEYFKQDEEIKALIGWYGLVLRSPDVDVVDLCRAYMEAVAAESCGKCIPCRTGTGVMADTLKRICDGKGEAADLANLETTADTIINSAKCSIGQTGPFPILHALEHFKADFETALERPETPEGVTYKARLTAPCTDACPIHLDIPSYVECIKEGKFEESLDIIRERLPIPGVVGRVCVRPCEEHCRRAIMDDPVSIKYLKRFVADQELAYRKEPKYEINPSEKTGKVAIIGAGPAGVTCAYHLAGLGHKVTIYEILGEPGGMAAIGIPDYRLPRHILRDEVEWIEKMGVTINYNTPVGKDITLSQLEEENDAIGKYCYEISHREVTPCSGENHPCPLESTIANREPTKVTHVHLDLDNNEHYISISCYPLFEDGEIVAVAELCKDITDEINVHKAMQSQEKLASIGRLAAGVAHEINNPMTTILTSAMLIQEETDKADPNYEDLKTIVDETLRCRKIVTSLLDFARQSKAAKKRVSIEDTINNCIMLTKKQAAFKDITIATKLAENLPPVYIDQDQIQQALINLLLNAIEATPSGGNIVLKTDLADTKQSIHIAVSDSGEGIAPENLSSIFDPFFTTKDIGTGLGLAITHGIIEQHGGAMDVKSMLGVGSIFTITLPVDRGGQNGA